MTKIVLAKTLFILNFASYKNLLIVEFVLGLNKIMI